MIPNHKKKTVCTVKRRGKKQITQQHEKMTQSRSIPDTHTLTSCQVPSHFWKLQVGLRGGWGQESWRRDMNRWWMRVKVNIKAPDRDDLMTEAVASTTAALPWASSPPSTPKIPAAGSEWHQSWRVSTTHTTTPQKKTKNSTFLHPRCSGVVRCFSSEPNKSY